MKVILQNDVKDLGKVGDVVNVAQGFARNFLFPRQLAQVATETNVKEWTHLKKVAEIKKKKAMTEREEICAKVNGLTLNYKVQSGENDKIFGSITTHDISKELEKLGHIIDRRDIHLEEPIKMLGQHKATIRFAKELEAEIVVSVARLDDVQ